MKRIVLEQSGQTFDIDPDEIDDLIVVLAGLKRTLALPPGTLEPSSAYLTYQQANDLLRTLMPDVASDKVIQYRIGRIWMACQRSYRYGNIPYDGFCQACGVHITDEWKHAKPCSVYETNGTTIAISKISIIVNRDQFAAVTYRGATPVVKEAYQLLADYLVQNGTS